MSFPSISDNGIKLIKQFEGLRLKPYNCPAGYKTIGYGHLIAHEDTYNKEITLGHAEFLLYKDLAHTEAAVKRLIQVPLTQNQFDALMSFTFNLGAGALQRSTLRQKINREEHTDVPHEFKRWVLVGGKQHQGLVRRRNLEAQLYST